MHLCLWMDTPCRSCWIANICILPEGISDFDPCVMKNCFPLENEGDFSMRKSIAMLVKDNWLCLFLQYVHLYFEVLDLLWIMEYLATRKCCKKCLAKILPIIEMQFQFPPSVCAVGLISYYHWFLLCLTTYVWFCSPLSDKGMLSRGRVQVVHVAGLFSYFTFGSSLLIALVRN